MTARMHNLTIDQLRAVETMIELLHSLEAIPGWAIQYGDNPYQYLRRAIRSSIMYVNGSEYADAFLRVMHSTGYEWPTDRAVQDEVSTDDEEIRS